MAAYSLPFELRGRTATLRLPLSVLTAHLQQHKALYVEVPRAGINLTVSAQGEGYTAYFGLVYGPMAAPVAVQIGQRYDLPRLIKTHLSMITRLKLYRRFVFLLSPT